MKRNLNQRAKKMAKIKTNKTVTPSADPDTLMKDFNDLVGNSKLIVLNEGPESFPNDELAKGSKITIVND